VKTFHLLAKQDMSVATRYGWRIKYLLLSNIAQLCLITILLLPTMVGAGLLNCMPNPLPSGFIWELHRYYYDDYTGTTYYDLFQDSGNTSKVVSIVTTDVSPSEHDYFLYRVYVKDSFNGSVCLDTGIIKGSSVPYPWNISPSFNFQPPLTPVNLTASTNEPDCVQLTWDMNLVDGKDYVFNYEIWRSDTATNDGALYATVSHTNRVYQDPEKFRGSRFYRIRSMNQQAGNFVGPQRGSVLNGIDSVYPTSRTFVREGGSGIISVTAESQVVWQATCSAEWITLSNESGIGNGGVGYSVSPWTNGTGTRTGFITFGTLGNYYAHAVISQIGADFTVEPTSIIVPHTKSVFSYEVTAESNVWWHWQIIDWSMIGYTNTSNKGSGSGIGSSSIYFTVFANTSLQPRSGPVVFSGITTTVTQAGMPTKISPVSAGLLPEGGSASFSVEALPSTPWSVQPSDLWVHVLDGSNGMGNGVVQLNVEPNLSILPRAATVSLTGNVFAITQAGVTNPVVSVSPGNSSIPATGGSVLLDVGGTLDVPWTAATDRAWLTIVSGATSAVPGNIQFTVSKSTQSVSRSGTIRTVTTNQQIEHVVTQAGFVGTLQPTNIHVVASGVVTSVYLSIESDCRWSVQAEDAWIQAGPPVVGSANVPVRALENSSVYTRTGTVTIGGALLTIAQEGRQASIAPDRLTYDGNGDFGTVSVAVPQGTSWESSESLDWVEIFYGSGTGTGTVVYGVHALPAPNTQRSGIIMVAGQPHYVLQSDYTGSVAPTSAVYPAEGGTGAVEIAVASEVQWQALPGADWISILSGSPGTGLASIVYVVDEYAGQGASRTSVLFVAGGEVKVTQNAVASGTTLPFFWAQRHWPSGNCEGPDADQDGDSYSNWQEWLAGSDPNDRSSRLTIKEVPVPPSPLDFMLSWMSITNRRYSIYATDSLLDPWPTQAINEVLGTGGLVTYTNGVEGSKRFIRLGIGLP